MGWFNLLFLDFFKKGGGGGGGAAPVHQMQQYYRLGVLDNCSEKFKAVFDCLYLKTKRSTEVQVCCLNLIHF
jgi:hypothetical protein